MQLGRCRTAGSADRDPDGDVDGHSGGRGETAPRPSRSRSQRDRRPKEHAPGRGMAAQGEPLDLLALAPAGVPKAQASSDSAPDRHQQQTSVATARGPASWPARRACQPASGSGWVCRLISRAGRDRRRQRRHRTRTTTAAQTTGRQRGDGGRPSGNSSSSSGTNPEGQRVHHGRRARPPRQPAAGWHRCDIPGPDLVGAGGATTASARPTDDQTQPYRLAGWRQTIRPPEEWRTEGPERLQRSASATAGRNQRSTSRSG